MKLRPSPALVVAVLALVVALGGTSYAAAKITSGQIANGAVKSVDIKNDTIKGKDVKDGGLTGADVKDGSLDGTDVANGSLTGADVKDKSLTSADIDHSCPATTVAVLGVCIDKASTGTMTNLTTALSTCDARNGRLMTWQEYKVLITKIPLSSWANGSANQYEFLDMPADNGVAQAIDFLGNVLNPATGSNVFFRCVIVP